MAKSLLLNILVDVLGKYVEGLTAENLKLGVWSGKIEFYNLKLRDSALDELNLPIQVRKGSLKTLKVKVPWTSLESKPVEVLIDGLYLLASPQDLSRYSPEEGLKLNQAMKLKKLQQIDAAAMLSVNSPKDLKDKAKQASYFQQLATYIVDNLEVQVTNIHIRYEDPLSDPGRVFCMGITLDKIILTTTDEQWNVRFVKRDANNRTGTSMNKLGTICNVGLYWNIETTSQAKLSSEEWERNMFEMIYKDENRNNIKKHKLDFIVAPPNQLVVKLTHRDVCSEQVPNVDLIIETSEIKANFDRQQFRQIMVMNRSFGELDRKRLMCLYRPYKRAKEDPRAWWHYAYRLVTGRDLNTANKVFIFIAYCIIIIFFLNILSFRLVFLVENGDFMSSFSRKIYKLCEKISY
jgi:vacuolar protein sorting-associated protein 13A/C